MRNIVEQLVEIYRLEPWHKVRMTDDIAYKYHEEHLRNGDIVVYKEGDEVLGYYEAYYLGETCFFYNVYIKQGHRSGRVVLNLYKQFLSNLPKGIKNIVGESQKENGKLKEVKLRRN